MYVIFVEILPDSLSICVLLQKTEYDLGISLAHLERKENK